MSKWRRFEVLFPRQFNDGREISRSWVGEAIDEVAREFDAASLETQNIEGRWAHAGVIYLDVLVRIVIDMPAKAKNRTWMRQFKARWKERLEQLELWMISHRIDVE